jgi:hypothetical protein
LSNLRAVTIQLAATEWRHPGECCPRVSVFFPLPSAKVLRPLSFLAAVVLTLPLSPAWAQSRSEGFGQWQSRADQCRRNLADGPGAACMGVQLNQRLEGLLNVSFVARGQQKGAISQLTFVGELKPGSPAMACRNGRCSAKGPMQVVLSSVSETSFDGRGLAEGLPKAWPVNGTCVVEAQRFSCQAKALSGEQWSAEATTP